MAYRRSMNENDTRDIARLRVLRNTLLEMERPGFTADDSEAVTSCRAEIGAIEAAWPDDRLTAAYDGSSREAGDPEADALSAELRQRGLTA
jgi:hypothetical protein